MLYSDIILEINRRYKPKLTSQNFRYFIRNQSLPAEAEDLVIAKQKKAALAEHDKLLRKFRYSEALDKALESNRPEVAFAVVEELVSRGGLDLALRGRDEETLIPVIHFLSRHIRDPRYAQDATDVCHRLLDIYPLSSSSRYSDLMKEVQLLSEQVGNEVRLHQDILGLQGMLDTLLSAST
jgi:U3 small nucleolar RNA-associated protein 15